MVKCKYYFEIYLMTIGKSEIYFDYVSRDFVRREGIHEWRMPMYKLQAQKFLEFLDSMEIPKI